MSFLTLFTADAAAAHGHEFSKAVPAAQDGSSNDSDSSQMSRVRSSSVREADSPAIAGATAALPRRPRSKTSYHLAQPPPTNHRHSLKAERTLIAQVQRLSHSSRPTPVYDVLPASVLGSRLKFVSQCLKNGMSQQDIVLLQSEEYVSVDEEGEGRGEHGDRLATRRAVAMISQTYKKGVDDGKQRTTVVALQDGSQWEANPLASGGYEFVSYDQEGRMRVGKWLLKTSKSRRHSANLPLEPEERKLQFSMSDIATGKRPILGWMSQQRIDILDRYPSVATPDSPAVTPPSLGDVDSPLAHAHALDDLESVLVPDILRILIVATGIWVALRERLMPQHSRTDDTPHSPLSPGLRPTLPRAPTLSFTLDSPVGNPKHEGSINRRIRRSGTHIAHEAATRTPQAQASSQDNPRRARSLGGGNSGRKTYSMNSLSKAFSKRSSYASDSKPRAPSRPSTPPQQTGSAAGQERTSYVQSPPASPTGAGGRVDCEPQSLPPLKVTKDKRRHSLKSMVSSLFRRAS